MGCIGNCMSKPVFYMASSTNSEDFCIFLRKISHRLIRGGVQKTESGNSRTVFCVLDNASAHHTEDASNMFKQLDIVPLWLPPYCPQFNSIGKYIRKRQHLAGF